MFLVLIRKLTPSREGQSSESRCHHNAPILGRVYFRGPSAPACLARAGSGFVPARIGSTQSAQPLSWRCRHHGQRRPFRAPLAPAQPRVDQSETFCSEIYRLVSLSIHLAPSRLGASHTDFPSVLLGQDSRVVGPHARHHSMSALRRSSRRAWRRRHKSASTFPCRRAARCLTRALHRSKAQHA